MKTTIGKPGLSKTWQATYPNTTQCSRCNGEARIGFVVHECMDDDDLHPPYVYHVHSNEGKGGYWPHDCITVAVYFCRECLQPTALFNQA